MYMQTKAFTNSITARIKYWRNTKSLVDHIATPDPATRHATRCDRDMLHYASTSLQLAEGAEEMRTLQRLSMYKFFESYTQNLSLCEGLKPIQAKKTVKVLCDLRFCDAILM